FNVGRLGSQPAGAEALSIVKGWAFRVQRARRSVPMPAQSSTLAQHLTLNAQRINAPDDARLYLGRYPALPYHGYRLQPPDIRHRQSITPVPAVHSAAVAG